MLLLAAALLGLLAGLLSGGSLRHLFKLRFQWPLLVVLALLVKQLSIFGPLAGSPLGPWLYAASLVGLIGWILWHRAALRGAWLLAAGIGSNLLVVLANGAHMPVTRELARRGPPALAEHGVMGQYVLAGPDTRLFWLADWIALPGPLGTFFPQAYSPGDLVAFAGLFVSLLLATRPQPPRVATARLHLHEESSQAPGV